MANILIIGGAGFIGSNLAKTLQGSNKVFVFDLPNGDISRLKSFKNTNYILYGKLGDYDYLRKTVEDNSIDIVIHLVSGLLPCSDVDSYIMECKNVIEPTIQLLPYLSERKIKFIFFSSGGTIYGSTLSKHVKETENPSPISYYGLSKQILEDSIQFEHRTSGLNYLIIRPSNPYGPGQNIYGKQGLISTSIGKILNHEKIVIWGDGNVVRDYLYIDDLSYAIAQLIKADAKNEIFNIGSGKGYSVNEIIQELRHSINEDFNVEYADGRAVDVPFLVLDNSKLRKAISFLPVSLKAGISRFINYQKSIQ
jgi:UDP-glucose 4-epimerase